MPWFSDTTHAPKIYTEMVNLTEKVSITTDTGLADKTRTVSIDQYEFRGLTEAASDTIATAKAAETNTNAAAFRMNDAGAFGVRVTKSTLSAWS